MDVIAAIHGRRSVRSYQPTPVPRELIEAIITDSAQAPPPFRGIVPWAFNVIDGAKRIAVYGERAMDYARTHRPESSWLNRPGFKIFWDAPAVVIISGPVDDCARAGQRSHCRVRPWGQRGRGGAALDGALGRNRLEGNGFTASRW